LSFSKSYVNDLAVMVRPNRFYLLSQNCSDEGSDFFGTDPIKNNLMDGGLCHTQRAGYSSLSPPAFSEFKADFKTAHTFFGLRTYKNK
jgi:hypothetical protein